MSLLVGRIEYRGLPRLRISNWFRLGILFPRCWVVRPVLEFRIARLRTWRGWDRQKSLSGRNMVSADGQILSGLLCWMKNIPRDDSDCLFSTRDG
jgi:hypothetical protein